uniref:Uncharacterized protein n=1 Tax=Nelumbo nucifera TaxID=4432 RepID=A0A822ZJV1_NELNU|nr:TPA_asm: hypothetical protein HUJ06_003633 [Nelumbo nucifera]
MGKLGKIDSIEMMVIHHSLNS